MKRILSMIFCIFLSFTAFSEDYDIIPFSSTSKEVFDSFNSKGWKFSSDSNGNLYRFTPFTKDKTFRGDKIKEFSFTFDENGRIESQCVLLDDGYSVASGFYTLLCEATYDKAQLENFNYESQSGIGTFTYFARLKDYNASYTLYSVQDGENVILMVMYTVLPFGQ